MAYVVRTKMDNSESFQTDSYFSKLAIFRVGFVLFVCLFVWITQFTSLFASYPYPPTTPRGLLMVLQ